jgi:hypothetical protein
LLAFHFGLPEKGFAGRKKAGLTSFYLTNLLQC